MYDSIFNEFRTDAIEKRLVIISREYWNAEKCFRMHRDFVR